MVVPAGPTCTRNNSGGGEWKEDGMNLMNPLNESISLEKFAQSKRNLRGEEDGGGDGKGEEAREGDEEGGRDGGEGQEGEECEGGVDVEITEEQL